MTALILTQYNPYQYKILDTHSFHQFLIVTHDPLTIGSRVTLNIDDLISIKHLSDIGAYKHRENQPTGGKTQ